MEKKLGYDKAEARKECCSQAGARSSETLKYRTVVLAKRMSTPLATL